MFLQGHCYLYQIINEDYSNDQEIWYILLIFYDFLMIYQIFYLFMIANPSDPEGLPLFSRFARNDAMKHKSRQPSQAASPSRIMKAIQYSRKKAVTYAGFDKQQSRNQRQRRFMKSYAPPVGQYNPMKKQHPKLVWDVLKAYQHQLSKQKHRQNQLKQSKPITAQSLHDAVSESDLQGMLSNGSQPNMSSLGGQSSLMSSLKSQCMVDMSRTTGRKEQKMEESVDWGDTDIMKPLSCIKERLIKNIDFSKQLRPIKPRNNLNNSDYNYDYKFTKPRRSGMMDFSSVKGREQRIKMDNQYAYQHYDYDSYVWQNNSRVFPNTKKQLVQFRKQMHRYKQGPSQLPSI